MSDGKGPTFDEAFDEWQAYLDKLDAAVGHDNPNPRGLRSLMAMARSEIASRQRMIELDRQRFDVLRDDYEKVQVALASTRLAMVEIDRMVRERNDALASFRSAQRSLGAIDQELGLGLDTTLAETLAEIKRRATKHDATLEDLGGAILKLNAIRMALGMPAPANHDWREPKVVKGVKALVETREAALSLLREMANHPCTAHGDVWQRACDMLVAAESGNLGEVAADQNQRAASYRDRTIMALRMRNELYRGGGMNLRTFDAEYLSGLGEYERRVAAEEGIEVTP